MPQCRGFHIEGSFPRAPRCERRQAGAVARTLDTCSRVVQSVLTQVSREATHDSDRAAGQTVDVVPDGTGQMAEGVASQQSLQSGSVEPAEKRSVSDFLSTTPLALSGEVLQMLRLGMHDVAMGRPGGQNGLLRVGWQSPAELVFRLMSPPCWGEPPPGDTFPDDVSKAPHFRRRSRRRSTAVVNGDHAGVRFRRQLSVGRRLMIMTTTRAWRQPPEFLSDSAQGPHWGQL
jgi:hypothetical protein